jgi:hypothetical protein
MSRATDKSRWYKNEHSKKKDYDNSALLLCKSNLHLTKDFLRTMDSIEDVAGASSLMIGKDRGFDSHCCSSSDMSSFKNT